MPVSYILGKLADGAIEKTKQKNAKTEKDLSFRGAYNLACRMYCEDHQEDMLYNCFYRSSHLYEDTVQKIVSREPLDTKSIVELAEYVADTAVLSADNEHVWAFIEYLLMSLYSMEEYRAQIIAYRHYAAVEKIEMTVLDNNEILGEIRDHVREHSYDNHKKELLGAKPTKPSHYVVHREKFVDDLCEKIRNKEQFVLVNGIGGIGKTTVAECVCDKLGEHFVDILWVPYSESLRESLLDSVYLFEELKEDKDARYTAIKRTLEGYDNILLVLDNVSKTESQDQDLAWLRCLDFPVFMTSRIARIGDFTTINVDFLNEDDCIDLFYIYTEFDKERQYIDDVRELVCLAGCHTLLTELLAKSAGNPARRSWKEFHTLLLQNGFDISDMKVSTKYSTEPLRIVEHIEKLYDLMNLNEEQQRIAKNFAVLPTLDIPFVVEEWMRVSESDMVELCRLGILSQSEEGYRMHVLVKESIQLQGEIPFDMCGDMIKSMSIFVKPTDTFIEVRKFLPLAADIVAYYSNRNEESSLFSRFINNMAGVYESQGDYPKALEFCEKALAICKKVLGSEHPDTATTYNNIAGVYESQGDYPKALEFYEKALAICKKVLGSEHPDTATTYNNMAVVYESQGDYLKALEFYETALAICEKVLGLEHPDTATTYNNIAVVYKNQGDYPKALEFYEKALAIREKALGSEHPDTATTYNNIAGVYHSQREYPKAMEFHEKDLAICEKVLGTEHPSTATTYNNMAVVYESQRDYPKALEFYEKALAIREKVLGSEHPDIATTYNNMAGVYYGQGDYPKALEFFEKALTIREKVLGSEHPSTATTYNSMAVVYESQGDYPKALEFYEKALAVREKVLGLEHPSAATTYNNIAGVYKSQGDYPKALEFYEKALAIKEKVLGLKHPDTAATYNNIAGVYYS